MKITKTYPIFQEKKSMKKMLFLSLLILVVGALVLAGCASNKPAEEADPPVPAPYGGLTNPFAGQADAAAAGQVIYTDNCASCHGDSGKGDGAAGASLDPKPANLVTVASEDSDDRINWIINEGGPAMDLSASMVAWKDVLSEDEIWQVITYIRTLK
jgi:mono/diheme cytochrome c family protein